MAVKAYPRGDSQPFMGAPSAFSLMNDTSSRLRDQE